MNFFDFFSLQSTFDIDLTLLEKRYLDIQKAIHPDKLSQANSDEKYKTLNSSIEANNAYTTLKTPLLRAKYLLSLNGINIDQEIRNNVPATLLQESFIDREQLENTNTIEKLKIFLQEIKKQIATIESELSNAFKQNNNTQVIIGTINLQYKAKLFTEIKQKIKKLR